MKKPSKNVLITGVSSGIGYGVCKELVKRGYHVFGSVRKKADSIKLSAEFDRGFTPVIMDVTIQDQIDEAYGLIHSRIKKDGLGCLINNAGIAIGGPLQHQSMDEIRRQFEVNVFGLLQVTKTFLPLLGAGNDALLPPGRIINISSVGGKISAPFVGAYAGTKHAVEGLSGSLRRELLLYGIDVIIVGPGAVKTPIWEKGINVEPYRKTDYGPILGRFAKMARNGAENGLTIEYLGQKIADIVQKKNPKTRYAIVPRKFFNWTMPRILPDRYIDRIIKKKLFR